MNTTARNIGLMLGGISLVALVACNESGAKVLEASAVTEVVKTPHEQCGDQTVTRQKPVKDEKRVAGTLTGAVIGAVVGHEVVSGKNEGIATVGGAVAGGVAGNQVQKSAQKNATVQTTERVCQTVYDSHEEKTGNYRVRYELNGKEGMVTMDHDPGRSIPVQNGKIVL